MWLLYCSPRHDKRHTGDPVEFQRSPIVEIPLDHSRTFLEQPANPEEELVMPGIAVSVGNFHGSKNRIYDQTRRKVIRQVREAIRRVHGFAIDFANFVCAETVDSTAQQRGDAR